MSGHPFARATTLDELRASYAQKAAHVNAVFNATMDGVYVDLPLRTRAQQSDPNANETRDELLVRIRHGQDNSSWRPATEADFGIEPAADDKNKNPQPVCEEGFPPAAPRTSPVDAHQEKQADEPAGGDDSASDGDDDDDRLFVARHDDNVSCTDSSCYACAQRACPRHEPLHYHHDGCPACWNEAQRQECADKQQDTTIVPPVAETRPNLAMVPLSAVSAETWYPTAARTTDATGQQGIDDLCCPDCYMNANDIKPPE